MARSQQTFSKKEKEKKKQQKKNEKEQKREERKANTVSGKGLDAMLAYVDEFGNITDTPPDQQKRTEIDVESIQIGVARQEDPEPGDLIRRGTVAFFNTSKGFGFIRDHETQESLFVHINALRQPVQEGDKVTFETEKGPKGLNAVNVELSK
ncbi:MAG: cold shock domain-containing protein [Mucilaginibacter polytrichastri]|nr:cold shock domain-containing protein [Mucilaginibacter polytrichastri]